jgi:hypothetical protein
MTEAHRRLDRLPHPAQNAGRSSTSAHADYVYCGVGDLQDVMLANRHDQLKACIDNQQRSGELTDHYVTRFNLENAGK